MKRVGRVWGRWRVCLISLLCLITILLAGGNGAVFAAYGDIHGTIDTLEYDTANGFEPDIIRVSDNVYAVAYRGTGSDGFLKTATIATDGQIADTAIDTLEFDTADGYEPDIIPVSGNVYAIVYRGTSADGFLKTVSIAANGDIGNSVIDTLEFDTADGYTPSIINVSGSTFAIAYRGTSADGFIKTVSIAANGDIGNSVIDTLEFDTADGYEPDIIPVSGSVYAIAYRGTSADGFIKTVSIAANGDIGNSVIDTLEFDTADGYEPDIIPVSGSVYAIAYRGTDSDGFLKTVTIATDGQIADTVIGSLEFDTVNGVTPKIIHIYGNIYSIAYLGESSDGYLKTVNIETIALPAVTTGSATNVEETSATLSGTVTSDGGEACQYRFEYGTVSGGPYPYNTSWAGSVTSGQTFSANITGLSKGIKYYFMAEVKNSTGTGSGTELSLLTKPEGPVVGGFSATANNSTTIELSWVKGEGALRTMIRRDTAGYPASINDGIQVYFDTGTSFTDTGLEPETTYYYRAWSEVTGSQQWSDSYADASATTPSGPTSPTTVGGTIFPINKTAIIVPWIGSLVIMSFAAAGTVLWLRRKLTTTPKPIYDRIKSPR